MSLEQAAIANLDQARTRPRRHNVRDMWDELGLTLTGAGVPHANTANATKVMRGHPEWSGKIWLDTFMGEIIGPNGPWTDTDTTKAAIFMQEQAGIPKMPPQAMAPAIAVIADENRRSSAVEWLDALRWDGVQRLDWLFSTGFGSVHTPYTVAVSKGFLIGMVARAYLPGSKVDAMPVLEGAQGRGKSTGLRVLVGDDWFAEMSESPSNKDFYMALQGKLLLEIAELDAFGRADITAVKRVMTAASDRFRAPYATRSSDHPRQCVFSGTTNRDDWNRDPTGARRFLPIECSKVDLSWLAEVRAQLFAEAVHRYKAGENWWEVPADEAKAEQEARAEGDPWDEVVDRYLTTARQATIAAILQHGIGMPAERFTKAAEMRVASILRRMGWARVKRRINGSPTWVWEIPEVFPPVPTRSSEAGTAETCVP